MIPRYTYVGLMGLFMLILPPLCAQQTQVSGKVVSQQDRKGLSLVEVSLRDHSISTVTDGSGRFLLGGNLPPGEQVLILTAEGFETKSFPIVIYEGRTLSMGALELKRDFEKEEFEVAKIVLSDQELDNERNSASNISGLLSASKDIFFQAAAYDFSAAFFKPRGLDNEEGKYLINGIEMNKMTTGRPEFSEFGGLNDVQRNQIFYAGPTANPYQFGGVAGTSSTIMRASQYREGGKISYAFANQTYRGRFMGSYHTGVNPNGWAFSVLFSRRFGNHGYKAGTPYDTYSFFTSVEKQFSERHSLNFTGFYTPYKRGKSSALPQEVLDLKGRHYNPYWGSQAGEIRNSRMKEVKMPVFMLNDYWKITEDVQLNSNLVYEFGNIGNTRIDNGGTRLVVDDTGQKSYLGHAKNPAADYYQNLPSYFLRFEQPDAADFQKAFLAERRFREEGQLDWEALYEANAIAQRNGGNSTYILQEDQETFKKWIGQINLAITLSDRARLNGALNYTRINNGNSAIVEDLLGGSGFLDIDFFAEEPNETVEVVQNLAQSDLDHPDRIVHKGDRYKYNYDIDYQYISGFAQAEFSFKRMDLFLSTTLSQTQFQREGKFRNGYFPENSLGKGKKLRFIDFGIKGGALYKITGQHMIRANTVLMTKAPTTNSAFPNARQNEFSVIGLESVQIFNGNLGYIHRSPNLKGRIMGYYAEFRRGTQIGHYFTQGISGLGVNHDAAFVHEVATGVNWRNFGVEFGLEAKVTPTITLKTSGSFGQSVYTNNPNYYLMSEDFQLSLMHGKQLDFAQAHEGNPLIFGNGKTQLKNYHLSGGPERVLQVGAEYQDPSYWFVGLTGNFFSHSYIDVNKLRRSVNFTLAADGFPIVGYDRDQARNFLQQERLANFFLINLVGGKSWQLGKYYLGFFGVVSNLLGQEYKTGGFESGRKSNFENYSQDVTNRYGPQFGTRYFLGRGTTFYANIYLRF